MSTTYELRTFGDIITAIAEDCGLDQADESVMNHVRRTVNRIYLLVCGLRRWTFRTVSRDLFVPSKYTTGTAAVTNGSREVTFTGASLTDSMLHRYFKVSGDDEYYEIIAVDTANSKIKLATYYVGTTDAAASYTIFQYTFGLWPDFDEAVDIRRPGLRPRVGNPPFARMSVDDYKRRISQYPAYEGKALGWTVDGTKGFEFVPVGKFVVGYDIVGGRDMKTKQAMLFPQVPDEDYILHIDYCTVVSPLTEDSDEPLIPEDERSILFYAGCAAMSRTRTDLDAWSTYKRDAQMVLRKMFAKYAPHHDRPRLTASLRQYQRTQAYVSTGDVDLGSLFDVLD